MLKKENRLSKVVKKEKSIILNTENFKIKVFSTIEQKVRFALIVSKKVDKKAVVRNKTKRAMSEALKQILPKIVSGKDIVIYAKQKQDQSKIKTIEKEIREGFLKTNIIK